MLLIAAVLQPYSSRCDGLAHRLPSSSSRHQKSSLHQGNQRLKATIILSLEASSGDNAYDDINGNAVAPENWSQELQQKLAELLAAEATKANPGEIDRQPPPQVPDLTAFQKIVDQNAAGGKKTPSAFEETGAILSTPNESPPTSQQQLGNGEPLSMPQSNNENPSTATPTNFKNTRDFQEVDDDEDDGFFLAPDLYERSRDLMSADGSLDLGLSAAESGAIDKNSPQDMKAILEGLLASSILEEETGVSDLHPYNSNGNNNNDNNEEDDWDQVWAAIQKEKSKPFDASRSEELHKQVFEDEQGFLEQSQSFRDGLTDPEVAKSATQERRSAKYRQRQAKAQAQLEQNMMEFEKVLKEQPADIVHGPETCSRCRCKLSESDYDNNILPQLWMKQQNLTSLCESCYMVLLKTSQNMEKRLPRKDAPSVPKSNTNDSRPTSSSMATSSAPRVPARDAKEEEDTEISSSWEEVEDPDSGEVFYWNEETDEVRWEIE